MSNFEKQLRNYGDQLEQSALAAASSNRAERVPNVRRAARRSRRRPFAFALSFGLATATVLGVVAVVGNDRDDTPKVVVGAPSHRAPQPVVSSTGGSTGSSSALHASTTEQRPKRTTPTQPIIIPPPPSPLVPVNATVARSGQAPPLALAVDGQGVFRVRNGRSTLVVAMAHPHLAYGLHDGSVVVQYGTVIATKALHRSLSRWMPSGRRVDYPQFDDASLVGTAFVNGHDTLLLVTPSDGSTKVTLFDVVAGRTRLLGFGAGGDSGTTRASIARGVLVTSESVDMGQTVKYTDFNDKPATGWPDLSKGLPYPSNDLTEVVANPDGTKLAFLDGPPFLSAGETDPHVPWAVVVVNRAGRVLVRVPVLVGGEYPAHFDFDGRWAVVSSGASRPAVIVDTLQSNARPLTLPQVGVATLAR